LTERPAAFVSFQRLQPSIPPHKNVNSADGSLTSACHFGVKYAKYAQIVIPIADKYPTLLKIKWVHNKGL